MGWGGTLGEELGWGELPWGAGGDLLLLSNAVAVKENVVRLFFSSPVKFTELLDPGDGSNAALFRVEPIAGTVGYDGQPARTVLVARVARLASTVLDLELDRWMTPYPSRYAVTVDGSLRNGETDDPIDPSGTVAELYGLRFTVQPNQTDLAVPRRDIASPNDLQSLVDAGAIDGDMAPLATFVVDDSGDYAADKGVASWKKRVVRRIVTDQGGFAHLPGYGVGLLRKVKQLGRREIQGTLAADAENQILKEPETVDCRVSFEQQASGLFRMRVKARSSTGETLDQLVG